jgi:hypothetical protein
MDPLMKAWMFHSWIQDLNDENKLLEDQGYLIGSFINPELVKKVLGLGGDTYSSSEEDFENTTKMLLDDIKKSEKGKRKRKRRIINGGR